MIAIGGTVGTGLFIGSGGALAKSGPVGALLAYAFIGLIVFSVVTSLGEMATFLPIAGAFTSYATRFVDPSPGFARGWIYWFSWAIAFALELTAIGLIVQYWNQSLSIGIFIAIGFFAITAINLVRVSIYGELEFWLSTVKVITVLGFLIFGICVNAGAGKEGYIGFKYWHSPGAFAPYLLDTTDRPDLIPTGKFVGFWAVLIQAGFSYQGTELVGITVGEVQNPRKAVPAAIRKTFYRILFMFVLTVFFIGILTPYTNTDLLSSSSNATASPLVIAAKLAGVQVLPGLINGVLLFVVISAANSQVYSGSRILIGLAQEQLAPALLLWTTKGGVPSPAVLLTVSFGLLAFLNLSNNGGVVFNWFVNLTGIAGFITWGCINACHIFFMRSLSARGISRHSLAYKAPCQPYLAYLGLFSNCLIILTQGFTAFIPWNVTNFFIAYVSLMLFVVLYVGHKFVFKTRIVRPLEADLDTGRREIDAQIWEDPVPRNVWQKFWAWVA
ncbi:Arginine permease CAN1 [Exophiala dermatitidis]